MADSIRGDGLFRADAALAALVDNPERLDRARNRFSDSPPSYRSQLSGTTTRSESPNQPTEEQQRYEGQRWKIILDRKASLPASQFNDQHHEEYRKLFRPESGSGCMGDDRLYQIAGDTVRDRWKEQGIWSDKWDDTVSTGNWKHEEPLESESESETDSEAEGNGNAFLSPFARPAGAGAPKRRRPKSDEELRLIAVRRRVREREREATRPFHQFIYQISRERERMQSEPGPAAWDSADINTKAYENAKNTWVERGIWNRKWGILPGMSWKHEQPLEEMLAEEIGPEPVPEPAPRQILGPLPPVEPSFGSAAGLPNTSQGDPPAGPDPAESQNIDTSHLSPRPQPGESPPSQEHGQAQPAAAQAPGPIHSTRVSKGTRGKDSGPRRQSKASSKLLRSDAQQPQPERGPPEELSPVPALVIPPRRSRRLHEVKSDSEAPPDSAAVTPAGPANGVSRPGLRKSKGGLKSSSPAKPKGVSKRPRPRTRHSKSK